MQPFPCPLGHGMGNAVLLFFMGAERLKCLFSLGSLCERALFEPA